MIERKLKSIVKKAVTDEMYFRASDEAKICLNCSLPAKKCRPNTCKRYKEEMKKLKEKLNSGR